MKWALVLASLLLATVVHAADQRLQPGVPTTGFECKPTETFCTCSGYFDCEELKKAGVCGPHGIDRCTNVPGKPEVCRCQKKQTAGDRLPDGERTPGALPGGPPTGEGLQTPGQPTEAAPQVAPPPPTKPGFIWVDDHWERSRKQK